MVIHFFGRTLLIARVLEDDRSILPREVGRKKRLERRRLARSCAGRLSLRGWERARTLPLPRAGG